MQADLTAMRLKVISAKLESLYARRGVKNASAEKKAELKKQIDELSQRVEELRKQLDSK